jgi:hypothetical protein
MTAIAIQGVTKAGIADQVATPAVQLAHPCPSGSPACVEQTIAAMRLRLANLTAACEHQAVFALVYLRTTEHFRDAAAKSGYFDDPRWVNAEDALFAAYYFGARDAWAVGDDSRVPPAWRVAFEAAGSKATSAVGDLLLGMNAHVTRDLPFVLAASGLVTPTGASRKPDHDRVNDVLAGLPGPVLAEAAASFEPRFRGAAAADGAARQAAFTTLLNWRETAWRDAVALTETNGTPARARVARDIELRAGVRARTLRAAFTELPPRGLVANHCS